MEYLMLSIDLSKRSHSVEHISKEAIRKYIGGRGLGSYLLYNLVPAKADPLGKENHLIFTAGPASGTNLYFSSKANVSTKSPLTGIYMYSISSGILAHQMKKAGFWAIDITGIADAPTYIVIKNREVEFRDARPLWGMETAQAQEKMLGGLSPRKAATVAIGPAGEKLVKFASTFSGGSLYRCFGRGGSGCVMGAKNLKGIVVAGDGEVPLVDPAAFEAAKSRIANRIRTDYKSWAEQWQRYETAADLQMTNQAGMIPTRNWQFGQFDGWRGLDKSTTPMGWPEKARPCAPYCLVPGCRPVEVKSGPYKGAHSDIEWETIYAFGSECGIDKMEAVIAAGQMCDEFGIDTMTAGMTIGFAMECFEKGLINKKDTEGIELRFGDDKAMIAALKKLVSLEGFGKELAKGTRRLSQEIKGSDVFAMQAKGMEFGGYECRGLNGQALQFAVSPRGGCHHAFGLPARAEFLDGSGQNIKGKGAEVRGTAIGRITRDSLITCTFMSFGPPDKQIVDNATAAGVLSSLSGENWSVDDLKTAGERIMVQERLFNAREGFTRKDDVLPSRLLKEPKPDGPTKGAVVPLEELKDDFYATMGFDPATGNPTDSLLKKLGIRK